MSLSLNYTELTLICSWPVFFQVISLQKQSNLYKKYQKFGESLTNYLNNPPKKDLNQCQIPQKVGFDLNPESRIITTQHYRIGYTTNVKILNS